jgi:hypothetical protein
MMMWCVCRQPVYYFIQSISEFKDETLITTLQNIAKVKFLAWYARKGFRSCRCKEMRDAFKHSNGLKSQLTTQCTKEGFLSGRIIYHLVKEAEIQRQRYGNVSKMRCSQYSNKISKSAAQEIFSPSIKYPSDTHYTLGQRIVPTSCL